MQIRVKMEEITGCSSERFAAAAEILICKPHSVNKKLAGAMIKEGRIDLKFNRNDDKVKIFNRKLVAKNPNDISFEDKVIWTGNSLTFEVSNESEDSWIHPTFSLILSNDDGKISVSFDEDKCSNRRKELIKIYYSSFIKWCCEKTLTPSPASIRLVQLDEYIRRYAELKDKYGKKFIGSWTESTDAEKFVHEDVGIAAYLTLIWEKEAKNELRFVDLGCGNGLLVNILVCEGYRGSGLDLRKRKIWDSYENPDVKLEVRSVIPDESTTFPECDWLIGNHSDELTPWIPVMAALTSAETKFFLLPCCPFEFAGKFQRRNQKVSLYRDYLDYVKQVGETCGFEMEEDRLKIPSTKRVCFIGRQKNGDQSRDEVLTKIRGFLPNSAKKRKLDFIPRPAEIKVQNCTKIDAEVKNKIVDLIFKACLEHRNPLSNCESDRFLMEPENLDWNRGGRLSLNETARLIGPDLLKKLKSEFGGLQTLLRNHNFIFIVESGFVRLRCHALDSHGKGRKKASVDVSNFRKKKLCWFFINHPQKCPLEAEQCLWAHGEDDLN